MQFCPSALVRPTSCLRAAKAAATVAEEGRLEFQSSGKAGSRKAETTDEKVVPADSEKLTVPPPADRGVGLEAVATTDVPFAETCARAGRSRGGRRCAGGAKRRARLRARQ